ncbi:hypothetical protein ACFL5G_03650 [Candidatus Margulisiibacteriota bacterium]
MAKKKEQENINKGIPLGGGEAVAGVSGMSGVDRVAQVRALQATSPLAVASKDLKVDVEKGFDLSEKIFKERSAALGGMQQKMQEVKDKSKAHVFNQHVEGLTYNQNGQEAPLHGFSGAANTELFSPEQSYQLQGGAYDNERKFKPPKKGIVE